MAAPFTVAPPLPRKGTSTLLLDNAFYHILLFLSIILRTFVSQPPLTLLRYKGMAICFDMLKASLAGCYINFGVMQLYGDDALNDALRMFVKLVMSIPQQDILVIRQSGFLY